MFCKRTLIGIIILINALIAKAAPTTNQADLYMQIKESIGLLGSVYREINTQYVDQIDPQEFMRAGIEGMLETLDPYTVFLDREETDDLHIMTAGQYGGVGIEIGVRGKEKVLTVISPIEDSPASRLGIRPGDQIIEINGQSTTGFTTSDAAVLLRGEAGTTVNITIDRIGAPEPLTFTLEREMITVHDITYSGILRNGIGYIKLTRFSRNAGEEIRKALLQLQEEGMTSLILDLRYNPGGLLPAAVEVAQNFVAKGDEIVSTLGRSQASKRSYFSKVNPICPDIPMVVLVDEGSASASEIVAGALQDLDRAVIVGKNTFGKGLVQSLVDFKDGRSLKITTARYYTPSGRLIQKLDYFNEQDSDVILKKAIPEKPELEEVYYTKAGRIVHGRGGISPDIEVTLPDIDRYETDLLRGGYFYDFCAGYLEAHPQNSNPDISPDIVEEFRDYLKEKDFRYQIPLEKEFEDLVNVAESDTIASNELQENLAKMKITIEQMRPDFFSQHRDFIIFQLSMEMAGLIDGKGGRILKSMDKDTQMSAVLSLLLDPDQYAEILSAPEHAFRSEK